MTKICNDRSGPDKWLHVFACLIIGFIIASLLSPFRWSSPWVPAIITFCAVMTVGIIKEILDYRRKGNHFCVWDLLADTVSAILSAAYAWTICYYTWHGVAGNLIQ